MPFETSLLPDDPHDRRLVARVHPPGRVNPTPKDRYDLVVVGGGTAGLVSAAGAVGLGASVALVERGLLGGDCLNVGCVPSKAVLAPAHRLAAIRHGGDLGLAADGRADFAAVMERMRRLRADISEHDSVERFTRLGVDVFLGEGRFVGRDRLQVGSATLAFRKAILATGGRPAVPDVPGLADAGYLTNETVFTLTRLPARLVVLGGGPIGCELSQAFGRLGTEVHLVGRDARLLPRDDAEAAGLLERSLRADGVHLHLGTTITRVAPAVEAKSVTLADGTVLAADAFLVAAGRKANVEGLGLDAAGVAVTERGLDVDDYLRTSNRRIYAVGDVAGRWQFTHAADAMARLAIRNALFPGKGRLSRLTIPWCTYTEPEVAQVGPTLAMARAANQAVDVYRVAWGDVDRARLDGETDGFVQVLARKGTDAIVGATAVGGPAGDAIGAVSLAMTNRLGVRAFAGTVFPYPTQLEVLRKLGDQYNRTRLTPFAKGLIGTWLRWGWW